MDPLNVTEITYKISSCIVHYLSFNSHQSNAKHIFGKMNSIFSVYLFLLLILIVIDIGLVNCIFKNFLTKSNNLADIFEFHNIHTKMENSGNGNRGLIQN